MNPKLIKKKNLKQKFQIEIPTEIFLKGKEMVEAYYNLFIFENFFRLFIENVAKVKFGLNYWKKLNMNKKIQDKINDRKEEERIKRWLSIRGDSDLFYADLIDLKTIISSNWEIFKEYFPKEVWITSKLEDLYDLRNKIAHNSYLNNDEQNTLKILLTNIYSQLGSKQKYRTILEPRREEIEPVDFNEEDYLLIEDEFEPKLIKIDFELVNNYLEMLDQDKIAYENISDILHSIHDKIWIVSRQETLNEEDLLNFKKLCKILLKFMKNKDDRIKRRVLGVLEDLTRQNETKEILKENSYEYIIEFYKNGNHDTNLLRILDSFDFFEDLEKLFLKAIDQEDESLLSDYYNSLDFSKGKNKRIEIIRSLNLKLQHVDQSNKNLQERIKKIIWKFENL